MKKPMEHQAPSGKHLDERERPATTRAFCLWGPKMEQTTEIDARRGAKVSQRVVRAPRRRNCIEQSTLDPEHEITVGGDHGRPGPK